jgi:hypothetical protein
VFSIVALRCSSEWHWKTFLQTMTISRMTELLSSIPLILAVFTPRETLKCSTFADISCIPYDCETAGRNGDVSSLYGQRREEQVVVRT